MKWNEQEMIQTSEHVCHPPGYISRFLKLKLDF